MLPLIQPGIPLETLEARVRKSFVVIAPTNAFVFKEVNDGRNITIYEKEAITVATESIAASRRNVVRLARGANTVHIGQQETLIDQRFAIR